MTTDITNWFTNRNLQVRPYQVSNVQTMFDSKKDVLLFDATGAGKSTSGTCFIDLYHKMFPTHNILFLAHGTKVIKENFIGNIISTNPDFSSYVIESSKEFDSDTTKIKSIRPKYPIPQGSIVIGLPQSVQKIDTKFELIVIDEPHEFFNAEMITKILQHSAGVTIKKILMTATPRTFLKTADQYTWVGTDLYALRRLSKKNTDKYVCNIKVDLALINSTRRFDIKADFLADELREHVSVDTLGGLEAAVDKLNYLGLNDMVDYIKNPINTKISLKNKFSWNVIFRKLQKTIIYSRGISHATEIHKLLIERGIKATIAHSKVDKSSINDFKTDDTEVLVVVNMARLGYDNRNLYNVIDFTFTINTEVLAQIFGRLSRVPDQGDQEKLYLKIAPANLAPQFHQIMSLALHLLDIRFLRMYGRFANPQIRVINIFPDEKDEWDALIESNRKVIFDESRKTMVLLLRKIKLNGGFNPVVLDTMIASYTKKSRLLKKHKRKIVETNSIIMGLPIYTDQIDYFPVIDLDSLDLAPVLNSVKHKDDDIFKVYATGTLDEASELIDQKMLIPLDITESEILAILADDKKAFYDSKIDELNNLKNGTDEAA